MVPLAPLALDGGLPEYKDLDQNCFVHECKRKDKPAILIRIHMLIVKAEYGFVHSSLF